VQPCYAWWEVPYYWAGLKLYDLVAGSKNLSWSHFVSPGKAKASFPTLSGSNEAGKGLKGTVCTSVGTICSHVLLVYECMI
jgi:glycerol-3-phosphate dehydrogenase